MKVLLVDDDASLRKVFGELLRLDGYDVVEAANAVDAESQFAAQLPRLVVLDLMLPPNGTAEAGGALMRRLLEQRPATKIMVVSGTGDTSLALGLVRTGAYDFLAKPVDPDVLLSVLARARARLELEDRVGELERQLTSTPEGLVGRSAAFQDVVRLVEKVAPTDVPVLITGETGTGKEVIARLLHSKSRRSDKPFLAVNCGALVPTLLESTLFGHRKGSFTGAVADSKGLFVEADGGTLFLDELGDLEAGLQVKLLRVLESGEVLAVGAAKPTTVNVRIVSATHQPLKEKLREDLYWRVRGVELALPRLADRHGDLPVLAQHFLTLARALVPGHASPRLSPSALRLIENHAWPGNLRQLKHELQRALVLAGARDEILPDDLSPELTQPAGVPATTEPTTLEEKIAALERSELSRALAATGGNKSQAAEKLGLSRQGLLNKLARYGLK
jgi:DNA-binding NtrC family response regulator